MKLSRRRRVLLVAAIALVAGMFCAERFAVWYLVTAPNADEPTPAPRGGEEYFASPVAPPVTLAYEIISAQAPRYTVFALHGLRTSRSSMREWAQQLVDAGARVVLIDARGHGRSTGAVMSYGVRESLDMVSFADSLAARGVLVGKLGVVGFSCGATTAIQWAGRDGRIAAVVAVAPFATLHSARAFSPIPMPDFAVDHVIARVGRASGFDPADSGGLAWIEKTRAPVLFVHGDHDTRVSPDNSRLLFAHAPSGSDIFIVPGLTHATMLRDAEHAGGQRAKDWFEAHLR